MKIGIDIRLIGKRRTGDEAVFFNLVKNLAILDKKNEYFLFTDRNPERNRELKDALNDLGLKENFKVIHIAAPNRFWWNLWALPNHLRRNPVDLFHTQYIAPFWLPQKTKLILTIHDISFNFFPQFIKFSDLFFLKLLIPRSLRMAAKIIAVSSFSKREIEKFYGISPEKIAVAQNGVDFELFNKPVAQNKLEEIRKKYHLPEKFILYVGTLQPRKNIPSLIQAFQTLLYEYDLKDYKLVIVGNRLAHNFDPKIDVEVEKNYLHKDVIFPGWIDEGDKPAIYKLARCFVFPSLYEGFGLPILEAMAAGIPIASSDQNALLEVGGDAILASNANDPKKMAENIWKLVGEEKSREEMISKGFDQAKKFSWLKNAEKTLATYEDC